jgi:hypothetical protein
MDPKELKAGTQKGPRMPMFLAALLTVTKRCKNSSVHHLMKVWALCGIAIQRDSSDKKGNKVQEITDDINEWKEIPYSRFIGQCP